jgi:GAF domain-containing protein
MRSRGSPFSQELLQYGVRALLAVPICRDASFYGLFCFAQTASPRVWTTAEISMARTAADAVMSAYLRMRLENGLCENMRVLTEYDEALQDLLAQKETLAEVSGSFLRADAGGFGEWAAKALGDIGRLLELDGVRAAFHAEGGMDIFRWQESDLPRRIGREYGGLREAALHAASLHAPVAIDDTAEAHPLPQLARAAADEGLRSLLLVPLCGADSAPGALIGFKAIGVKQWAPAEISVMEAFAQVFSDAYHIKRARENEGPTGTPLQ